MELIKKTIKEHCDAQERSMAWLARKLQVSRPTLYKWDSKEAAIPWPYKLAICEKLDINGDTLDVLEKEEKHP